MPDLLICLLGHLKAMPPGHLCATVSADRYRAPLFLKSSDPQLLGPKPPVDRHGLKQDAAIENFTRPQPFVFNGILP
jgi:hypothetical protein